MALDASAAGKTYTVVCRGVSFVLSHDQIIVDSPNYFTSAFLTSGLNETETRTVLTTHHPELFTIILDHLSGYNVLDMDLEKVAPSFKNVLPNLLRDAEYFQLASLAEKLREATRPAPDDFEKKLLDMGIRRIVRFEDVQAGKIALVHDADSQPQDSVHIKLAAWQPPHVDEWQHEENERTAFIMYDQRCTILSAHYHAAVGQLSVPWQTLGPYADMGGSIFFDSEQRYLSFPDHLLQWSHHTWNQMMLQTRITIDGTETTLAEVCSAVGKYVYDGRLGYLKQQQTAVPMWWQEDVKASESMAEEYPKGYDSAIDCLAKRLVFTVSSAFDHPAGPPFCIPTLLYAELETTSKLMSRIFHDLPSLPKV